MTNLTINTDDALWRRLEEIARQRNVTVAEVVVDALSVYVQPASQGKSPRYSFIGIGRSGRGQSSVQAEEILKREADRRTGWGRSA
jgi:hypothetical protein